MGTRPCRSFEPIVLSKLFKTKNCQNDKKDRRLHRCCHRRGFRSPAMKPSTQLSSLRSRLRPSQFSSQKGPNCCPSTSFCKVTKIWSAPPPQSGTFNGGERVKKVRQPSCSPNSATADFYLFQRGEFRANEPLVDPGQPQE
jgi:hypothetical protein